MALINCPECEKQVSNIAATCPNCGAPIAEATGSKAAGVPLTTIQKTSKKFKGHIILSSFCVWIGLIWLLVGINASKQPLDQGNPQLIFPMILLFLGLIWYLITKIRIWWHHE